MTASPNDRQMPSEDGDGLALAVFNSLCQNYAGLTDWERAQRMAEHIRSALLASRSNTPAPELVQKTHTLPGGEVEDGLAELLSEAGEALGETIDLLDEAADALEAKDRTIAEMSARIAVLEDRNAQLIDALAKAASEIERLGTNVTRLRAYVATIAEDEARDLLVETKA